MFVRPNQHEFDILAKPLKLGSGMLNVISIIIFIIINIIINNFEKNIIIIKKTLKFDLNGKNKNY
jgi:hypothetical protein